MRPGEIAQCDLWFPPIELPVGFGQTRTPTQLPVLTMVTGYSRWLSAVLIPSRRAGPVRRLVAADRGARGGAAGAGLGRRGRDRPLAGRASRADRRLPGVPRHAGAKVLVCKPADPEAKGLIERAHDYLERSFLPGRTFTVPADFNTQLQAWLAVVNTRTRRALGCAPTDRITADRAAMLALPPVAPATGWRASTRLPRDHYIRMDSNDYSVHPARDRPPDRGARRPGPGPGVLRGRAGRRPRTRLGLAPDHHRPRARRGRQALRRERGSALLRPTAPSPSGRAALPGRLRHRARPRPRRRGGVMATHRTATADRRARDLAAEVAFLTRALKAPTLREAVARLAERARAESWTPRGVPGRLPATRGLRPGVPRRRGPHPGRPVPRPEVPGGVRLRPRPRAQARH